MNYYIIPCVVIVEPVGKLIAVLFTTPLVELSEFVTPIETTFYAVTLNKHLTVLKHLQTYRRNCESVTSTSILSEDCVKLTLNQKLKIPPQYLSVEVFPSIIEPDTLDNIATEEIFNQAVPL